MPTRRVVIAFCVLIAAALLVLSPKIYSRLELATLLHNVQGIDVSHHQGQIDWPTVRRAGVRFAFIKATEGGDFVDSRFAENWRAANAAGIARGAYHFFTQCRPGKMQAENFIRTVPRETNALPAVVDAEHMGPCTYGSQVNDVAREIKVILDRLEAYYGLRPLIYTTREFHDAYLDGRFARERFWIRSLVTPPRFRRDQWIVWQYHSYGRRPGITGPVDLNVLRDETSLAQLMRSALVE